ncbi:hypothetical protein DQ04_09161010 [Trypanosoma grayi]|uniref:hypothetical protein n=1 Tax=Trypanosoma grayi TaxID=71804 RepID=UPI0004F4433D|nr:hypothetical protein DQ04_09161010 [Trypanosoma grayi]KEG07658.1 hypothetical protein DQ04_09161010 [Trypanosoma grayi]
MLSLSVAVPHILHALDRLRHSYTGLHLPRDAGVRIKTGVWRLQLAERLQRRQIVVERTIDYAGCIVDSFLMPVQCRGRTLGQLVAALVDMLPRGHSR